MVRLRLVGSCLLGPARSQAELVAYASYSGTDNIVRVNPDGSQFVLPGFNNPAGLAFDSAGNLYVASSGEQAILKLAPESRPRRPSFRAGQPLRPGRR